jgi:hypothetical protein
MAHRRKADNFAVVSVLHSGELQILELRWVVIMCVYTSSHFHVVEHLRFDSKLIFEIVEDVGRLVGNSVKHGTPPIGEVLGTLCRRFWSQDCAKNFGAVKGALHFHYFQLSMVVKFFLEMLCLPGFCCQGACRIIILSNPSVSKRVSSLKNGSNRVYLVTTGSKSEFWVLFPPTDLLRAKWTCAEML